MTVKVDKTTRIASSVHRQPENSRVTEADVHQRVCMFVYNNCLADVRVLKEARSLTASGRIVQIVAVLDKRSEPEQIHEEGFRVLRIDRNPPHYRLLRRSRLIRRSLRLARARGRRKMLRRRKQLEQRQRAVENRFRSSTTKRYLAHLSFLSRWARGLLGVLALLLVLPIRLYRAMRWRILRHAPPLRRAYYRYRVSRGGTLRRWAYRRRVRQRLRQGESDIELLSSGQDPALLTGLLMVPRLPVLAYGALIRGLSWCEQKISRLCYRAVMVFHKPLMFSDFYRRSYRLVRSQPPFDVVHAHDLNTLPVAAMLAFRTRAHLVYDAHELYTEISTLSRLEKLTWRVIERLLARRTNAVITVCDSIADVLVERYRVSRPTILLNCPPSAAASLDDGQNRLREKAKLTDSDEPIVLYQGGFSPNRGLEELVTAARYLNHGVVVLMGWGAMESTLLEMIESADLDNRVRLVGPADHHELLAFTRGADLGIIPYRAVGLNNYYTTPNKLFEYILAGIPVVGSRVPELVRFIEGHEIGLTFDPEDPQDIASAINYALRDPDGLHKMRENAVEASRRYVWEQEEPRLLKVYDSLSEEVYVNTALPTRRA